MTEINKVSPKPEADREGTVPLFSFLLFLSGILIGGFMVDIALGHSGPLIGSVAFLLGFMIAQSVIAYMPSNRKICVLECGGIFAYLAGMLFLSLSACDSFWLLSDTCIATVESIRKAVP